MLGSYFMNGALGLVFLVTYCFMLTDLEAALDHASGYPHIWVFEQALPNSRAGVLILNLIPTLLIFAGTLSFNLTASRCTWAFARDKGLPASDWLAKVDPKVQVPANAVTITCVFTVLLTLINLGSDVAFNASKYSPPLSAQFKQNTI